MGREVRKVPADWQHPTDEHGDGSGLESDTAAWDAAAAKWAQGQREDGAHGGWMPFDGTEGVENYADWDGLRPDPADYMPAWTPEQATHLMMYETTSEGSPISPAFATAEELAEWLANSGASWWGGIPATRQDWLGVANLQHSGGLMMVRVPAEGKS